VGDPVTIGGSTASGFEGVRAAFARNFTKDDDVGAGFAAYHGGELVVDLWGGLADPHEQRAWESDTLALVFSTTKGMTAMCAHRLVQAGDLDVAAPVASYWPEFAQNGKADITVEQLLTHEAGLAWVDHPVSYAEALEWEPMVRALELQAPHWEPGTAHGYHAVTYGHLVGEVVRRITGRTLGRYFRDEIAEPLGLELWIGLPAEHEPRVARLVGRGRAPRGEGAAESKRRRHDAIAAMTRAFGPDAMIVKALTAGGAFAEPGIWNDPALHAAEVPGVNGIGDARSVARAYAACIGTVDGVRVLDDRTLRAATLQRTSGPDVVLLDIDLQFARGFIVHSGVVALGGPRSFGHFGMGGSVGWADPEVDLACGYAMNGLSVGMTGDARSYRLVKACYQALAT
jgi:CubicO group peptidase (beta-lactamase class C family)